MRPRMTIGRKLVSGFALAVVTTAVVGVVGYRTVDTLLDGQQMVSHTNQVLATTEALRSDLKDAETGQRGYLITGVEDYLAPYQAAQTAAPQALSTLRSLTADNPHQQARLDDIEPLVASKFAELKDTIDLRRDKGFDAARAVVLTNKGKVVMDSIRGRLTEMEDEEKALLGSRSTAAAGAGGLAKSVMLFGTLLDALLVGLAAFFILRSITRPVRRVTDVTARLAEGDLTAEVEVTGNDEIADMSASLNRALATVREAVRTAGESAGTVAAASTQLTSTSSQIAQSADDASQQAGAVASASEQVTASLQTVSASSEEMGASIREISQNAVEAARVAGEAAIAAERTNETVRKLGDSSRQIGDVIKVISAIAEQTNLLALNATIEAARAGDAGKGFAVVANEVKELAQETAKATDDIAQRVEAIQADSMEAVQSIAAIAEVIGSINSYQTTISAAVEEQTATTGEMARNVSEAASGSTDITERIAVVAGSVTQTTDGVKQALSAADELARMAGELKATVDRFRY